MEQPKILVAIRKRPLSKKEQLKGQGDIVTVKSSDTVIVSQYKQKVDLTKYLQQTIFNFDFVFDDNSVNQQIYDTAVRPLVDSAFQGAKVTCFAYGQTGSGKTFTMNGNIGMGVRGLYTLGAQDIFSYLASPHFKHLKAKLAFFQIYCGKLFDLLHKRAQLKLREDNKGNINIIGLQQTSVESAEQFAQYLQLGSKQRITSMNSANADSSRSHAILQISLKDGKKLFGKISFIDLAGNQRGADHMDMSKQTKIDGAQINKSLLSLKQCIRALDQGSKHTPFRGSKLTMVLRDSFVGFCRTVMIGNVSPSSASSQNTLNTLRYADRVKQLRKPQQSISKQQQKARQMMLPRQNKNAIKIMINNDDDAQDIARKRDQAQREYGLPQQPVRIPPRQEPRANMYNKNLPSSNTKQQTKTNSTSIAKTGVRAPSLNTMIPQLPINQNKTNIHDLKRNQGAQSARNQIPGNLNRYNSHQPTMKQQFMDIQSSSSSPYYVPNNRPSNGRMVPNTTKNLSNISSNSFNQQINLNQRLEQQQRFDPRKNNFVGNYYDNNTINQPQRNYQQPFHYPQDNFHTQKINMSYQAYQRNPNQAEMFSQQNNSFSFGRQQPQQHYQFPHQWQNLVSMANPNDPRMAMQVLDQINRRIQHEQQEVVLQYRSVLGWQLQSLKSQHQILNEFQRSQLSGSNIDEKISKLQQMRQMLNNFSYKIDCKKQIQRSFEHQSHDDQQLLDDIN